jgi:hypothetical protein
MAKLAGFVSMVKSRRSVNRVLHIFTRYITISGSMKNMYQGISWSITCIPVNVLKHEVRINNTKKVVLLYSKQHCFSIRKTNRLMPFKEIGKIQILLFEKDGTYSNH